MPVCKQAEEYHRPAVRLVANGAVEPLSIHYAPREWNSASPFFLATTRSDAEGSEPGRVLLRTLPSVSSRREHGVGGAFDA